MSFRFYRSVRLGKGLRLNLSKTGVGVSTGVPGLRYSVHSSGRTVRTAGIPGTGLYYRKDTYARKGTSGRASSGARSRSTAPARAAPPAVTMPHAGLLAPKEDKVFVEGVRRFMRGDHAGALAQFQDASARDAANRYVGEELFEAMCLVELDRMAEAIAPLETVVRSDAAIPDARMIRYHIEGGFEIQITPFTTARVPMSHLTAALMLAEVYQHAERTEDAIRLLESLGATSSDRLFALSLAELYDGASRWNNVVRVTDEFTENTDDVGLQLVLYRGHALQQLGMSDGALAMCKEALRFRKREPQLLHVARYLRAQLYDQTGKHALARKDLERIYAEAPGFSDVAAKLGVGSASTGW